MVASAAPYCIIAFGPIPYGGAGIIWKFGVRLPAEPVAFAPRLVQARSTGLGSSLDAVKASVSTNDKDRDDPDLEPLSEHQPSADPSYTPLCLHSETRYSLSFSCCSH
jgi:hypothetical protein